jgi:hypothetical protein
LDPDDDARRLANAIADKAITQLFSMNGSLVLFSEGAVTRPVLLEIITKTIAGVRLVAHDGTLKVEYFSFDFAPGTDPSKAPDDKVLTSLMNKLLPLVAKGPSEPKKLSNQQQHEVQTRASIGEPKDKLAREYGVDIATIRQLVGL